MSATRFFIFSASKALDVAEALAIALEGGNKSIRASVWSEGSIQPGSYLLPALKEQLDDSDFAVVVLSPDDSATIDGQNFQTPRQDVVFELGLSLGTLGNERAIMVLAKPGKEMRLPWDIQGIVRLEYEPDAKRNLSEQLRGVAVALRNLARSLGPRPTTGERRVMEAFQQHYARFGARANSISSRCEVGEDGSCGLILTWDGVTTSGASLSYIPGQVWVGAPEGRIDGPPTLTQAKFSRPVRLEKNLVSERRINYRLILEPVLTTGDPPLCYTVATHCHRSVLLDREEARKAFATDEFKYDYHSFDVILPCSALRLAVQFPHTIPVKFFPAVFFHGGEQLNHAENNRVAEGFKVEAGVNSAVFSVRDPLPPFRYAICWELTG